MPGWRSRTFGTAAALLALLPAGSWVNPALACACGAMVADDDISVSRESSLVRWDGTTQRILMGLDVETFEEEAALLLPTPAPADVELGDRELFGELSAMSRPDGEYHDDWWPGHLLAPDLRGEAGGQDGSSDVEVLGESEVGPFDVTTLSADDPDALRTWLDGNDYEVSSDLADALDTYVEEGWYYAAVKLGTADGEELSGGLDPLSVTFESDELVYPMRLSQQAETAQDVRLYLLADHRMERTDNDADQVPGELAYAGWLDPDSDTVSDELADLIGAEPMFLTTMDHDIADPAAITSDFVFEPAAEDTEYQRVEQYDPPVYILGIAGGPFLVAVGTLAGVLLIAAGVLFPRWRRRRARERG
ncbi:hypothetical protein F4561_000914 [Lipingzhangella halophila]|uniref:DUF2330 domain-containing protein n=1 Tax=Lipingzhangella halophila TaxID=1783352 RepID=A0A7W7RDP2_9ACTN|nr:DUF2330 domain-containing protein [Lipingzhangella halophila]MBB4930094.1 hypothetical protein [Lipingzhangella halophila]